VVRVRDGGPLPGVTVKIASHPEFGQTTSADDGSFALVVNGGGPLLVTFAKLGYLPAHRRMSVDWQAHASVPDVALVIRNPNATHVTLGTDAPSQLVEGSEETDSAGTRRALLFVPPGTGAYLQTPGGTLLPVSQLTVHSTEYTVGPDGPAAMPAPLPPNSGYTYAIEYAADEADQATAQSVLFSQPLVHYVDNFLNFPVGGTVPAGYYDRQEGRWIASDNGRVVAIANIANGVANMVVNRSGVVADGTALAALGISEAERRMLAAQYVAGQQLWRVPIPHFSSCDLNWLLIPKRPAPPPVQPPPQLPEPTTDEPTCEDGCVIEPENRVLGETIPVVGTPFSLTYRSSLVPGALSQNTIRIPLTGPTVSPNLLEVVLYTQIAGRTVRETFAPNPNTSRVFAWDGRDATGQEVQGPQGLHVWIGYTYPGVYGAVWPDDEGLAFLDYPSTVSGVPGRERITMWQSYVWTVSGDSPTLGHWLATGQKLGGWTLNVHHAYDPLTQTLYQGSGARETAASAGLVINPMSALDYGSNSSPVREGQALNATTVGRCRAFGIGDDGTIYLRCTAGFYGWVGWGLCDLSVDQLWRVSPDGALHLLAGNGHSTFVNGEGDGGTAINAPLSDLGDVTLAPDGSLYLIQGQSLRRISRDGIIDTVAGRYVPSCDWAGAPYLGEGGPSKSARIGAPVSVAADQIGNVFVCSSVYDASGDFSHRRLFRIGTNGIFSTIAGTESGTIGLDGIPGKTAHLGSCEDLVASQDGSIYFVDYQYDNVGWVRRMGWDGVIETIAGKGSYSPPLFGDNGPAASAYLGGITGLSVAKDGAIYVNGGAWWPGIRRIDASGTIRTVASWWWNGGGAGEGTWNGPSAAARAVAFDSAEGVGVLSGPDGTLVVNGGVVVSDGSVGSGLFRLTRALPGFDGKEFIISDPDGTEYYEFSPQGRHLRTRNALTGRVARSFSYSESGLLVGITDANGLTTVIERESDGNASAIIAPNGQRTTLGMDPNGYLASVSNPNGETEVFTYSADGLMATHRRPGSAAGNVYTFDGRGLLVRDEEPNGGFSNLSKTQAGNTMSGSSTSAMGRVSSYTISNLASGGTRRESKGPDGLTTVQQSELDGTETTSSPTGEVVMSTSGPDPRFGMQAPLAQSTVVQTPAGKQMTTQQARTATTDSQGNLLTQVDTTTINGKAFTTTYSATSKTMTTVSPVGRRTVSTLDDKGRVVQVQPGNLAPTAYSYDSRGRLATVTVGSGTSARVTTFGYDSLDRLASVTDPLSRVQSYVYDDANRVVGQVFTDGSQVGFSYDANGNVTSVTPPSRPEHDFGYTPADLMSSYTPPAVAGTGATTYEYNLDKQPRVVHRPDGSQIVFGYDGAGRLSTVTYPKGPDVSDGTVTVTGTYNASTGKLASVNTSDGQAVTYGYDGALLLSTTWSGTVAGSVSSTYDNNFRAVSESVNGANTITFGYDNDGLPTSVDGLSLTRDPTNGTITDTTLGGVTDHRTYDNFGQSATYEAKFGTTSLYSVSYVRDSLGRIEQKTETIQGTTTVWGYSYDSAGRLWQVMQNGVLSATYLYDANGNRLSKTGPSGTETATYDDQDRLLTYAKWAYTYTANGELRTKADTTTGQVTTYSYDGMGNLRHVALPDGRAIDYVIDSLDRRVAKKVNGAVVRQWLYGNGTYPAAELDATGAVVSHFVVGGLIKGTTSYRVVTDHLGSPRLVVNTSAGTIAQRMEHDEWGQVTANTSTAFTPFGFAHGIYDEDTGLVSFGARDYDAEVGRWTAKDPIRFGGHQTGFYAYLGDDPINGVDPSGLRAYSQEETACLLANALDELRNEWKLKALLAAWNNEQNSILPGSGKWDFKVTAENDTFNVNGWQMTPGQFGNYFAGYVMNGAFGIMAQPINHFMGQIHSLAKDHTFDDPLDIELMDRGKFDFETSPYSTVGCKCSLEHVGGGG
jgi:RHS repeat-associated protein